jgi:hypothetical protein
VARSRFADAHPAAVTIEAFNRVQQLLDGRLRPRTHECTETYLLDGLLSCGYCGAVLSIDRRDGCYVCRRRRDGHRGDCPHSMRINRARLEATIEHAVATRILSGSGMQPLLDRINAEMWRAGDEHRDAIERAQRKVSRIEDAIAGLLDLVEQGQGAAVRSRLAAREAELATARRELKDCQQMARAEIPVSADRMEFIRLLEDLRSALECGTPAEQRAVLTGLVDSAEV